jgi:UDP-N-acetylglucosamine:LPS N-acetylglucosamine transferase
LVIQYWYGPRNYTYRSDVFISSLSYRNNAVITCRNARRHPTTLSSPYCDIIRPKIVIFGGGQGLVYYNSVYVLDTITRTWRAPTFPENDPHPTLRRAHTAVLYNSKIWYFGGGNGQEALNDIWTLTVNVPVDKMRWEEIKVKGRKPTARGYHTANLVGNVMVVMGGSDGKDCFSDVWCFNLGER